MAAELTGLHPQTLRTYERMGLITPGRTGGGGRRYSHHDLERLRKIASLTSSGIGIEGVRRIMELENQVAALTSRNEELIAELEATREALRLAGEPAHTMEAATACPCWPTRRRARHSWSGAAVADQMPCPRRWARCNKRSALTSRKATAAARYALGSRGATLTVRTAARRASARFPIAASAKARRP